MPSIKPPKPKYGVNDVSAQLTFTKPRATLSELLEFANAVRRAGGGNPLDALMPAVPKDPHQCLIAKNLNFNCHVDGMRDPRDLDVYIWFMRVDDFDIQDRIAKSLNLKIIIGDDGEEVIVLPPEIGRVASDFDEWLDVDTPEDVERLKTFWPYIAESEKEAYRNADFVNEEGELVI